MKNKVCAFFSPVGVAPRPPKNDKNSAFHGFPCRTIKKNPSKVFRTFAFPWGVPNGCETDEGRRCCSMSAVVGTCEHRFPSSVMLTHDSSLACRLGRRFCLRQRCPPDTRGLACRLGRRFCLRQRCPPDTRAPREAFPAKPLVVDIVPPGKAFRLCNLSFFCTEICDEPKTGRRSPKGCRACFIPCP